MKKAFFALALVAVLALSVSACTTTVETTESTTTTSAPETPVTSLADNVEITDVEIDSTIGWVTATIYNGNDVAVDVDAVCDDGTHSEKGYAYDVQPDRYEEITFFEDMSSSAMVSITDVSESW